MNNELSKREYFASIAMQGLLSDKSMSSPDDYRSLAHWKVCVACRAVSLADELINELNETYD